METANSNGWSASNKSEVDITSGRVAWECSFDLAEYIRTNIKAEGSVLNGQIHQHSESLSVLELGCGRGIPSCSLLSSLQELRFVGSISVCFQDYDQATIDSVTRPAVEGHLATLSREFRSQVTVSFVVCDWMSLDYPPSSANIILSSECVYRSDLFESHAGAIERSMRSDGVALIAAKRYYFGCGGGTIDFSEYLSGSSSLHAELAEVFENGFSNTREILILAFRSS